MSWATPSRPALPLNVVQLSGAVIFDGMPVVLGVVHAGDWLGKMLLIALILSTWRTPQAVTA